MDSLKWILLISGFIYYFRTEIKNILNRPVILNHGDTTVTFPLARQVDSKKDQSPEINKLENTKIEQVKSIQGLLEKKESEIKDKDQQIFKLTIEKHFEYTYRLIFRSQIFLLQTLQTITDGLLVLQLDTQFQNTKKSFEVFKNWNLDIYLKFLYDQNLIQKDSVTGKIKITALGDLFLKYLVISVYDINNEKTL